MNPSNRDQNLPDHDSSDSCDSDDLPDPINLKIRRLERKLATYKALCDQAYLRGYNTAAREAQETREIPGELLDALRYGHAHEHHHVPVDDHLVAVVLASPGQGRPQPRREAKTWAAIRTVHRDVLESSRPGIDLFVRRELPSAIGALTWRWDGHVAVICGEEAHWRCLKRAIRCVSHTWALLLPPIAWTAGKVKLLLTHLATPTVSMSAAAAVTAIATTPMIVDNALQHGRPPTAQRQVDADSPALTRSSPAASPRKAKPPRARASERPAPRSTTASPSARPTVEIPPPVAPPSLPPAVPSALPPVAPSSEPPVAAAPEPSEAPSVGSSADAGSPSDAPTQILSDPTSSPPEEAAPAPTPVPLEAPPDMGAPTPSEGPDSLPSDPTSPSPVPEGMD